MKDKRLLEGRYVDQNGVPLGADDPSPHAEFKMMPVRLKVLVAQGKVSDLLVNCANCTMPIDVRRIDMWSKDGRKSNYGGGGGMGGGGDDDDGPGFGGRGMGRGGGRSGFGAAGGGGGFGGTASNQRGGLLVLESQKNIPVEIEGLIYIFNKPDRKKMGTGTEQETAASPSEGEEPPVDPESTPPEATPETEAPANE